MKIQTKLIVQDAFFKFIKQNCINTENIREIASLYMVAILIFISVVIFLCYAALIFYYRNGWTNMPNFILNKQYLPTTKVSIVIPARNEEKNIKHLLKDILSQYYPTHLMEIIVVDDHSTDQTAQIIQSFQGVKYINLSDHLHGEILNAYKKKAIETAIAQSEGELIITTDADCRMGAYWLLSLVQYFEKYKHQFIAAPVQFSNNGSFFQTFQSLDFITMQGITGAVVYNQSGTMCNGANLAYTKKAFHAVGGFKDIDDIASGDDMLLMYKIEQKYPARIGYLKCPEAIVTTAPMQDLKSFLQQRIRWASKATKFKDKRIQFVLGLVYFFNLTFLMLQLFSLQNSQNLFTFFGLLILKTAIEMYFLKPVCHFFKKEKELYPFFILQFIHIPYILLSGLMGQFGSYRWKERIVK